MKVELVSSISTALWADLLNRCPRKSPFQREGWARALAASVRGFDCLWLVATDSGGSYLGGIPLIRERKYLFRRYLSMPYGTCGGPVLAEEDEGLMADLVGALARLLAESKTHSFFCALPPFSKPWPDHISSMLGKITAIESSTHVLRLTDDFDSIWMGYQKRNRNIIRKAVKSGAVARVVSGVKPAETLYRLYRDLARNWHGHVPHPLSLVEACVTYPGRPFAQIWQAVIEDEVHGSLLAIYDDQEVFPWLMGSTPYSRTLGVNNFLVSEMIRDACNRGLARVNLGGSMGDPGIEHFKRALGAEKTPVTHYVWDSRFAAVARRARGFIRRG